jgi:hypothetical protein
MAAVKLPKTIYVRMEDDGDGGYFPAAYDSLDAAVDGDGPTVVGFYTLASTDKVRKVTEVVH